MKMKRVLAACLAAMLVLGLTACGGKAPTAESLLSDVQKLDTEKYYSMNLDVSASAETDEGDGSVDISLVAEGRGDVVHLDDVDVKIGVSGFSMRVSAEAWIDLDAGTSYIDAELMGQRSGWIESSLGDDPFSQDDIASIANVLCDVNLDKIEPELLEREKGDDYVVTWEMDGDGMVEVLEDAMESFDSAPDLSDADVDTIKVEAVFDAETQDLKSFVIAAEGDVTFSLGVEFTARNVDEELEIPSKVIKAAAESETDEGEWTLGGDEFDVDSSDESDAFEPVSGSENELISNDGAGYDEIIDPMAEVIASKDPGLTYLSVSHYTGGETARLSYATGEDDWNGSIAIERVKSPDDWNSAEKSYKDQCDFLASWYESAPAGGGANEKFVIYVDDSSYLKAELACYDDDFFISGSVYVYDETDVSVALSYLNTMLETAGVTGVFDASALG